VIPSMCSLILLLLLMREMLLLLGVIILLLGESSMPPTAPIKGVCGGMLLVDGGRNRGSGSTRRGRSIPANSCWDAKPRPKPMDPELRVLARDDDGAGGDTNPGSCCWIGPAG
jgi:hypothetical protein